MRSFELGLDLYQPMDNIVPRMTQFDTGGIFNFTVYSNGSVYDITGHTMLMKIIKPSGKLVAQDVVFTNAKYGMASATIPEQGTTEHGLSSIVIDLLDKNGNKVCLHQFKMLVTEYSDSEGGVESADAFPILQTKLTEVQNLINEVNTFNTVFIRYREV